jgi:hypothetical protein
MANDAVLSVTQICQSPENAVYSKDKTDSDGIVQKVNATGNLNELIKVLD